MRLDYQWDHPDALARASFDNFYRQIGTLAEIILYVFLRIATAGHSQHYVAIGQKLPTGPAVDPGSNRIICTQEKRLAAGALKLINRVPT